MYYFSRKKFKKESKTIYKKLFYGFSFIDCNIKNKENRYKEHFAEILKLEDLPLITESGNIIIQKKKETVLNKTKSYCYCLTKEERILKINNALAETLGFKSFFEYKRKMKFKIDRDKMPKIESMSFDEYITFIERFKNNLKKEFKFTKDININLNFLNDIYKKNKKNLLNNKKEFYDSLGYFYNTKELMTNNLKNLKDLSDEKVKVLKDINSLNIEPDLYVESNDKNLILKELDSDSPLNFINKINYMYEVESIRDDLKALSDADFNLFLELSLNAFYKEFILVLCCIRKNKNNEFLSFLNELNYYMREREIN